MEVSLDELNWSLDRNEIELLRWKAKLDLKVDLDIFYQWIVEKIKIIILIQVYIAFNCENA
jgi:hypothetical protein